MTTAFCMFIRPSPSVFWLLTALTACITGNSKAQDSPVSFHVHGGVSVSNDVVYLQTTTLLNVPELYRLPPAAPEQSGIQMQPLLGYESGARVELRVYDYDDEKREKGMLIYAATGTHGGWNEESWSPAGSLFSTSPHVSEKLTQLFNGSQIPTTNIKVLSQFAGLGSVCADQAVSPFSYIDGALGNVAVPLIGFHESASNRKLRDDDDECESRKAAEEAGARKIAAARAAAEADAARQRLRATSARCTEIAAQLEQVARLSDAANGDVARADQALTLAENELNSTFRSAATASSDYEQARQESEKSKQVFEQKAALLKTAEATYATASAEFRVARANKDRALANYNSQMSSYRSIFELVAANERKVKECTEEVNKWQTEIRRLVQLGFSTDHWLVQQDYAKLLQAEKALQDANADLAFDREWLGIAKVQTENAANELRNMEFLYLEANMRHEIAIQQVNEASKAEELAYYANKEAVAVAATLREKKTNLEAKAIQQAEIVGQLRSKLQKAKTVLNELRAAAMVLQAKVDECDEEMKAAKEAVRVAEARLKDANDKMQASAEVIESLWPPDDDDDSSAGAAAVVEVAGQVVDPQLSPLALVTSLLGQGWAYLFDDNKDEQLFHNELITPDAIHHFRELYSQCSENDTQGWCANVSPMPVVLVELAIKNASVQAIKVPGLPLLMPDRMFSRQPVYDNKKSTRYIKVSEAGNFIDADGKRMIVAADYTRDIHTDEFPKLDFIKTPALIDNTPHDFYMDTWNRLPLVGTPKRLRALEKELESKAISAGIAPDQYFSFRHISHNFMAVQGPGQAGTMRAPVTQPVNYELWILILNKEHANHFATTVTVEGPFEASNGPEPANQQERPGNSEILLRTIQTDTAAYVRPHSAPESAPIAIFPNPTKGKLNISCNMKRPSLLTWRISTIQGITLFEGDAFVEAGVHTTVLELGNYCSPGAYLVSVTTSERHRTVMVYLE